MHEVESMCEVESQESPGPAEPGGSDTVAERGIHEDVPTFERNRRLPQEVRPQAPHPTGEVGLIKQRDPLDPGWWRHLIVVRGLFDERSRVIGSEGIQRSDVCIRHGIAEFGGSKRSKEIVEVGQGEPSLGGAPSVAGVAKSLQDLLEAESLGREGPPEHVAGKVETRALCEAFQCGLFAGCDSNLQLLGLGLHLPM